MITGFGLIRQPGLRRFAVVPLLINCAVFAALIGWLSTQFERLLSWAPDWQWLEAVQDWWLIGALVSLIQGILWLMFALAALIAVTYTFAIVANLIAAPFNSLLAEKVEAHLRGHPLGEGDNFMTVLKAVPKTLWSEVQKLVYLGLWAIPLLLISFVPVVNLASPVLWFLFGAWMLSLEYWDYPMGNHNHLFKQIKQAARQKRSLALGFGAVVTACTAVPILNLFTMPAAVAGATALWVNELDGKLEH